MPIKLIPPRQGFSPYWYGRGAHLGVFVDRSTKTDRKALARRVVKSWEREIERDLLDPKPKATFLSAAVAYMNAGGDARPVAKLVDHFGETALRDIGQAEIDHAASTLFPSASAATRNRECYTPMAAILHRAGIDKKITRPIGWRGKRSTAWLEPDQAFAVFTAAYEIDPEFGLLVKTLCYTGMRLGEALATRLAEVNLQKGKIYLPETKNGHARSVYLPQHLIVDFANQPARQRSIRPQGGGPQHEDIGIAFMERDPKRRLFRFHAGGALRDMLKDAFARCKLSFPSRQGGFHIFCHTYGTWMHDYAELDTYALTRTKRWTSPEMADRYTHTKPSSEAMKAELLPAPTRKTG